MKTIPSLFVASCALLIALGSASASRAQMAMNPDASSYLGGLLGESYSGVEFGYIRRHEGAPRSMQRYGFMVSRPLIDAENLDGTFRYNYTRGSILGAGGLQNDFTGGVAVFRRHDPVAPFFGAEAGWAYAKAGALSENSFLYQLRLGAETMVSREVSLTPMVTYRATPRLHDYALRAGVKGVYRLNSAWAGTVTLEVDDDSNVEFAFSVVLRQ